MILCIHVCKVLGPSLGWERLVTLNPTEIMSRCNTGAGVSEEVKVLQLLLGGTKQVFSFLAQLLWWFSAGKAGPKVSCLLVAPQVETLSCYSLSPCQALTGTVLVWSFMVHPFPPAIVDAPAVPTENTLVWVCGHALLGWDLTHILE